MTRIPLRGPADVTGDHAAIIEALDAQGSLINLYRAMANSPEALRRFYAFVAALWSGALDDRTREIAILSAVAASDAPYPLGWHLLDAADAGLSPSEVRAIVEDRAAVALTAPEASIARFARDLARDARVSDAVFTDVAAFMSEREIVELTLLVAAYRMVACVANALGADLDDAPAQAVAEFRAQ
jgi:alkylhydroperoxidase family enzyme